MSNGGMINQLKELAERQKITANVAYPLIFQALAEIMEKQEDLNRKFKRHEEEQSRNAMIVIGDWIKKKPKAIIAIGMTIFMVVQALTPALIEEIIKNLIR